MLKILIADDQRDTVLTLGVLLRSEGYEIRLVEDGAEVLPAVDDFRPDAVLLDLLMPAKGGLEIARELKQRYPEHCPVLIAITGRVTEETRKLAAHSGFQYFLTKPYDPDLLLKLIGSIQAAVQAR